MFTLKNAKPAASDAQKAVNSLAKEVGNPEGDKRSAVTRMVNAVFTRGSSATAAKRAMQALRDSFTDWNEVRISDNREVITVLTRAEVPDTYAIAQRVRKLLTDIYQQHNVVNFEYEHLDEELFCRPPVPEGEEGPDVPTIREEGLPKHPAHSGFLDGERLLRETTVLDAKLVRDKNGDLVFCSVYDNPDHVTAQIVWAVGEKYGLVKPGALPTDAMRDLREKLGKEQAVFARDALAWFEKNSRALDKIMREQAPMPPDEDGETPFSVQIGFVNPEDVRRNEPLMPRSDGIGRESKRATPKWLPSEAKSARAAKSK